MPKLPVISGKKLITFLLTLGFIIKRTKGSHYRLYHKDGRVTTIPVHKNKELPKGLLRKIIREDLELDIDQFMKLWEHRNK